VREEKSRCERRFGAHSRHGVPLTQQPEVPCILLREDNHVRLNMPITHPRRALAVPLVFSAQLSHLGGGERRGIDDGHGAVEVWEEEG
jgi:hypothetical protein